MLDDITIRNIGPFRHVVWSLAQRMSVLTGDNGLGKSVLLEAAWYLMTGQWPRSSLLPSGQEAQAELHVSIDGTHGSKAFNRAKWSWEWLDSPQRTPPVYLALYLASDGTMLAADPLREGTTGRKGPYISTFRLTRDELRDGIRARSAKAKFEGMITDLKLWRYDRPERFALLNRVLEMLSPPGEPMTIGDTVAPVAPGQMELPTLRMPYGEVPITHASEGIWRGLALAYALVWFYHGHLDAAKLRGRPPARRLVLLIDEVEAHLHPKWQRCILPGILAAIEELSPELKVQMVVTTHSPLVTASLEECFDKAVDTISTLEASPRGDGARMEDVPWFKRGDASQWLMSEAFGLESGGIEKRHDAISRADTLIAQAPSLPPDKREEQINQVQEDLQRYLAADDPYWVDWGYHVREMRQTRHASR